MSTLLDATAARPRQARPARTPSRQPPLRTQLLVGAVAALRAAAFALLPLAVVVLVGWAGAGGDGGSSAGDALRVTVYAWLLGHGVDLSLAHGTLRLSPLGLTAFPLASLVVAATAAVRACGVRTPRQAGPVLGALTTAYAVLTTAAAVATRGSAATPSVAGAVLGGLVLAAVGGTVGALRVLRRRPRALPTMPREPGLVLAGAVGALATVLGAAGLLLAASLALHAPEAAASVRSLHPGPLGTLLLSGLSVLLLPNAVVFAAAYAVGPGFAVGAGTSVAPSGVVLGPLPDLPLLAALPSAGPAPTLSLLVLAGPALAGAVAGAVVARRAPAGLGPDRAAGLAALSGVGGGLVLGLLSLLAGGGAGDRTLAHVGPSAVQVGLAASGELALVAAAVAWLLVHRARSAGAAEPTSPA
ncbi:cell division protein PerM [Motilibacter peucedani]|nr:DUF6350 family protein [Motilibacter peucedani]